MSIYDNIDPDGNIQYVNMYGAMHKENLFGNMYYVNRDEIKKFGPLKESDIVVGKCENYIEDIPCEYPLEIKNKFIGKKNGRYIHKLYETNRLVMPQEFIQYNDFYLQNLVNPQPAFFINDVNIPLMQGGGSDNQKYYRKYKEIKKKYLSIKK